MEIFKGKKTTTNFSIKIIFLLYRQYSDEDDDNDSPLSDYGRSQSTSRVYSFNNYHQ